MAAVAAAVLAAGVGAGTWVVSEQRVQDIRNQNAQVDAVLAAADARLISRDMGGGRVTLVVSPSHNAAVAVLNGLTAPGDDKSYALWMIDPGFKSVGISPSGTGRFYVPNLGKSFAITKEPRGGSPQPTLPAMVDQPIEL
jgi:anti-sigma-K factor RskA